jgi:hypothetical protein
VPVSAVMSVNTKLSAVKLVKVPLVAVRLVVVMSVAVMFVRSGNVPTVISPLGRLMLCASIRLLFMLQYARLLPVPWLPKKSLGIVPFPDNLSLFAVAVCCRCLLSLFAVAVCCRCLLSLFAVAVSIKI